MSALTRKLIRDMGRTGWQYLSVTLLVVIGVAWFGTAYMSYKNLELSYQGSYDRLHFEDMGVWFHAGPKRIADRMRAIPGVSAVEGRLVEDVAIELPGPRTRKMVGHMISIPMVRDVTVNQLQIVSGRMPRHRTAREVLLQHAFADYHKLEPGDTLEVNRMGTKIRFAIAGIVKSPEYIYVVQSKQQIFPMPDTFGVMFVSEDVLGPLVGKSGLINEIRLTISEKAKTDLIRQEVKQILRPYRSEEPVLRKDQPSHQLLQQDLQGFQVYAFAFPILFLSVAGVTIYTLLLRLIHMQRGNIGLLRALGYTTGQVVRHYLGPSLIVGIVGGLLGDWLGLALAAWMTHFYLSYIAVPFMVVRPHPSILIAGFLVGLISCLVAAWLPAREAARMGPAEALRPPAPEFGRAIPLDRIVPGFGQMRLLWRIPFRNLFRHPRRTVSTLVGIAMSVALVVLARGLLDSFDVALNRIYREAMESDMTVSFFEYQSAGVAARVRAWPGVSWTEPFLHVPVDFRKGDKSYSALLTGMMRGSRLYRLKDEDGIRVQVPEDGIVVGQIIRRRLDLHVGDTVQFSIPSRKADETPRMHSARIAGFVWEPMGTVAYARIERVRQWFREDLELPPSAINDLRLRADPSYQDLLKSWLLDLPRAGAVEVMSDVWKMLRDMTALTRNFVNIMLACAATIAFCIVFTMVTVNVLERRNEIATLRTLGVSRGEITGMLVLENLMSATIGCIVGLPVGRALIEGLIHASTTQEQAEMFSFQVAIYPTTYIFAALTILAVAMVSQIPALQSIQRVNLAQATKERAT